MHTDHNTAAPQFSRAGVIWLKLAITYLIVGVALGIAMGATRNFALAPVHAHINLLGWTTLALAGLIYTVYPVAGASRLIASHSATWLIEAVGARPESRTAINELFREAGYSLYWFYAPFATPVSPKAMPGKPAVGDVNVVAVPRGSALPWSLIPVGKSDERAPTGINGYPYLLRYGYQPEPTDESVIQQNGSASGSTGVHSLDP